MGRGVILVQNPVVPMAPLKLAGQTTGAPPVWWNPDEHLSCIDTSGADWRAIFTSGPNQICQMRPPPVTVTRYRLV